MLPAKNKYKQLGQNIKANRVSYLMMLPYLIFFVLFTILPVIVSIVLSFTDYDMVQTPIFVGLEYFSLQGDITTWGVNSFPDHRIGAQPWLDYVNEQKGFCCACHPFRNNNRGLEENLGWVKGLHGVEVLNGSTPMETNRIALKWCKELGLQPIGASDAHVIKQIGKYATWLPERVDNLADFIALLRSRPVKPAIFNGIGYDVVDDF